MSFAYFDPVLSLLSEEIQVPLPKLKEAWTNSFLKYFKADASILLSGKKQKAAQEKKASEASEPAAKKSGNKLPTCEEDGCTNGVKNVRPIEDKIFCSKHYAKALKAFEKKQAEEEKAPADGESDSSATTSEEVKKPAKKGAAKKAAADKATAETTSEEVKKPAKKAGGKKAAQPAVSADEESDSAPVIKQVPASTTKPKSKGSAKKQAEPEPETEAEEEHVENDAENDHEDLAEELETEAEEENDATELLSELSDALNKFVKKPVTSENYKQVATTNQYFQFLKANWEAVQSIYPNILPADEVKKLIDSRKVDKTELYGLLEHKLSPKLEASN